MLIEFGCKGTTFFANNRLFLRIFVCEINIVLNKFHKNKKKEVVLR